MQSFAFLLRKAKPVPEGEPEGHGFVYIDTPRFQNADLRRLALIRPYSQPKVTYAGPNTHGIIQRSIGGPEPAVATQGNTILMVDPRGFAGNSPSPFGTQVAPIISNNMVNVSNQQYGGSSALGA